MEKQYYISKEQYTALLAAWSSRKNHSAGEHIIYNLLRSKPATTGFVERKKAIQGDDPWYAYKQAVKSAQHFCSLTNPWAHWNKEQSMYLHGEQRIKNNQKQFEATFGFEMPADFNEQLKGL